MDDEISEVYKLYCARERAWHDVVSEHFPGAELIKWGTLNRTFRCGDRIAKVQCVSGEGAGLHSIQHEFHILEALEGFAWTLRPHYRKLPNGWAVLELDWIDGESLEDMARNGNLREVSIRSTLRTVSRMSSRGVIHHQLRARHMFRLGTGEIVCVDFGGSRLVSVIHAFMVNFSPLRRQRRRVGFTPLIAMLGTVVRQRDLHVGERGGRESCSTWQRSVAFLLQLAVSGVDRLRAGSAVAEREVRVGNGGGRLVEAAVLARARHSWLRNGIGTTECAPDGSVSLRTASMSMAGTVLGKAESLVTAAARSDDRVYEDLSSFQLADYNLSGYKSLEATWERVCRHVEFRGRTVLDLGCGQGILCALSRVEGASRATGIDESLPMVHAARVFADAFGIHDNRYICGDLDMLDVCAQKFTTDCIAIVLSIRFGCRERSRMIGLLQACKEVIYQVSEDFGAETEYFRSAGFGTIESIERGPGGRHILHIGR